jgi:surfactin synthase thioesterase subunit
VTTVDAASRWLPLRSQTDPGSLPLFCLPHAGGGASAFRTWLNGIPGVAVLPVQPPGREARFREAPHERMAPLVDEIATVVLDAAGSGPYAVYGHSLGALVAFETLHEIRRRGGPDPVHLFVSGSVAPHCATDDGPPVAGMSAAQVVQMLRRLGGTPEWLLADPGALNMILPAFRADFSVKETYEYAPGPPLRVPVSVLSSTDDPRAARELQGKWQDQTIGTFRHHTLVGGHFAVFEQAEVTRRHLAEALAPWM